MYHTDGWWSFENSAALFEEAVFSENDFKLTISSLQQNAQFRIAKEGFSSVNVTEVSG